MSAFDKINIPLYRANRLGSIEKVTGFYRGIRIASTEGNKDQHLIYRYGEDNNGFKISVHLPIEIDPRTLEISFDEINFYTFEEIDKLIHM